MKNTFILLAFAFIFTSASAQDISDALRYSVDNLNGTARYRAMSGAFETEFERLVSERERQES